MSEQAVQTYFRGLKSSIAQTSLYPSHHPGYVGAIAAGLEAASALVADGGSVRIAIKDDACYLDDELLPHASLAFASLLGLFLDRGVESMSLIDPIIEDDYNGLVEFLIGLRSDPPGGGSIRLNEETLHGLDQSVSELQKSYLGAVGSLRRAGQRLAGAGSLELSPVMDAVDVMVDQSLSSGAASLLLSTISSHDEYTFYHSVNVCLMVVAMARLVGLDRDEVVAMGAGAVLHDVGKVAIAHRTLNHPGRLSGDQWQEIAMHPQEGAQAILAAGGPGHEIAAAVALEHHARYDGLGYPHVPSRKEPHLFSSMVSVVDVYDALTSRRPYRRSHTPNRALQLLLQGAGTAFDPEMVKLFIQMMGIFPPGSVLRLESGELVVVVEHGLDVPDLKGVLIRDAGGNDIVPTLVSISVDDVADQVSADSVGVEPAALINDPALAGLFAVLPSSRREEEVAAG